MKSVMLRVVIVVSATQLIFASYKENIKPINAVNIKTIEDAASFMSYWGTSRQSCPLLKYFEEVHSDTLRREHSVRNAPFTEKDEKAVSLLLEAGKSFSPDCCLSNLNTKNCTSHRLWHVLCQVPLDSIPFFLDRGAFSCYSLLRALRDCFSGPHFHEKALRAIILHPDLKLIDRHKVFLEKLDKGSIEYDYSDKKYYEISYSLCSRRYKERTGVVEQPENPNELAQLLYSLSEPYEKKKARKEHEYLAFPIHANIKIHERIRALALCMRHLVTVEWLNTSDHVKVISAYGSGGESKSQILDQVLIYLIENSDQEILELFDYLVGQGLEIPAEGKPLVMALKKKNLSAFKILIKACPKSAYGNLMRESLIAKDDFCIDSLLQHSITMTEEGKNFLHEACILGNIDNVLHLIKMGVDVNAISKEGKTPLDYAKQHLHKELVEALELFKSFQQIRLHDLVVRNDLFKVKLLIAAGESYNKKSSRYGGKTALALAVEHQLNDMIDLLLTHKADVSLSDNEGKTPLHLAAKKGSCNNVMKLLARGAHIESVDTQGATPLLYACSSNSNCLGLLYMQGASLDILDKKGKRPIHYACEAGASDVVDFLGESFQDAATRDKEFGSSDFEGMNALHYAALSGSLATVEKVRTGIAISSQDKKGRTALHYAAESGSDSMIKYLHDTETESAKDTSGLTPLHIASRNGHINFMQALIKLKAPLDSTDNQGRLPMHLAAAFGHDECVRCLIIEATSTRKKEFTQQMLDTPDIEGQTALHHAVIGGHRKVINELIAAGITLDIQDKRGRTSLHYAVENEDFEATSSLLNAGSAGSIIDYTGETPASMSLVKDNKKIASLFSQGSSSVSSRVVSPADAVGNAQLKAIQAYQACDGDTPLHMALFLGNRVLIKALIDSKQDINQPNSLHVYPIHIAVKGQNSDTVRELLEAHAQVDVCDQEGNTPLHYAAKYPNISIVRALLAQHASATIKNHKNLSPFQVASLAKNKDIALVLLGSHNKVLES